MKNKLMALLNFLSKYIPPAQPGINHWGSTAFPMTYIPPQEVTNKIQEEK